jgi:hypothetical protein
MKLTKSILFICLSICIIDSIISLTKIHNGSKEHLKHLRNLRLKKNRITHSNKRLQKLKIRGEDLETFLKESLINFKNKNELYEKTDPTLKESDIGKQGIIYEQTKSLSYKNQFFNDIVMVYKTFYPENSYAKEFLKIDEAKLQNPESRVNINYSVVSSLRRILFLMIDQGLYYSKEENKVFLPEERKDENLWKYPLASSICHGTRTIFLYNKEKMGGTDFFPQYFFGSNNSLLKPRSTASHKMQYDPHSNKYEEKKILMEAALDFGKSYFVTKHQGMNIPLGGVGNIWPDKKTVINSQGFGNKWENGQIVDTSKVPLQAGHLYVRLDSLEGSSYASIMMGLEEEMPGYKGMFSSHVHNLFNAFQAPSTAVCGGSKWKELGQNYLNNDVPNNYGGKAVFFDDMPNTQILDKIENFKKDLAKKVWWIILSSDTIMYKQFKEKYLMKLTEAELDAKLKSVVQ